MHQWVAHFDNGMRVVRRDCILAIIEDAPRLLVLSNWQAGVEFAYHFASGRFYRSNELIGECKNWNSRGGKPIAQRDYQVQLGICQVVPEKSRLLLTRLGVQKDSKAQYLEIYADNTYSMKVL